MSSLTLKTIDFHNQTLITFKKDDIIYTAVRPIVEAMGLDWASQSVKLNKNKEKFSCCDIATTGKDGKTYQMLCMPLRKLNGWLFSINPEKVRSDLKAKVIQYQEECFEVLFNYWNTGVAINPRLSSDDTLPLRNAVNMATGILKLDYGTIYKMVHQRFGVVNSQGSKIKSLTKEQIPQAVEYVHRLMLYGGTQSEQDAVFNEMWRKIGLIRHQENQAELHKLQSDLDGIYQRLAKVTKLNSVLYDAFVEPHRPSLTADQRQYAEQQAIEFLQHNRAIKQIF